MRRGDAVAVRRVGVLAGLTALVLFAVSGRYGYHRDELYFLACGRHLAWGYPDQPPLVPFLARLMSWIAPGSVPVLRLPSDLAAGATVLLTGALARRLGAGRAGQLLAAAAMAMSAVLLAASHLLSTTAFVLPSTAALVLLVVRLAQGADRRWWLVAGVVVGLGLLANDILAATMLSLGVGVVAAGPRRLLRSPWLWAGLLVALAIWSPYLVWQARHGWPELAVGRAIAHGSSGTSTPRWAIVPYQFVLTSVWLSPVWVTGLWRLLLRTPALRPLRFVGIGYLTLLAFVIASGGKGYYAAGYFPALFATGGQPVADWVRRARSRGRWLAAAFALSAGALPVVLPLVPLSSLHSTPVVAANFDAGETVGWPAYVAEIGAAYRRLQLAAGGRVTILASNYGEAGAIERYGARWSLPRPYSGDNGYWWWGPPPGRPSWVLAIGFARADLGPWCSPLRRLATLDNRERVVDVEQGRPVWGCRSRATSWRPIWRAVKYLG